MRWAGLTDVRVLDGGYAAWVVGGAPSATASRRPAKGDVTVKPGTLPVVDAEGARRVAEQGVLIDGRVAARYLGETEPIDPVAGHIPGAVNQPAAETVAADGRLHPPRELRARFEKLGVRDDRPVAAYCGSGVTAAHTALALTVAGFDPALYVGSWSHWITDPARPVKAGAPY
jgi:thiosulfate/3-mercaptopyruvate sulfurtransferase